MTRAKTPERQAGLVPSAAMTSGGGS